MKHAENDLRREARKLGYKGKSLDGYVEAMLTGDGVPVLSPQAADVPLEARKRGRPRKEA